MVCIRRQEGSDKKSGFQNFNWSRTPPQSAGSGAVVTICPTISTAHFRSLAPGSSQGYTYFSSAEGCFESQTELTHQFFGVCPRVADHGRSDLAWQIRTVRCLWADIKVADIRPVAKTFDWDKQRQMWRKLKNAPSVNPAVR
jgi:hypothetical protein